MPPAPSTWSVKDFSRLATATSSQSPLGHESRRGHPPSSDLKVPNVNAQSFIFCMLCGAIGTGGNG